MKDIRIALLDMNNNNVNQGFKNIKEISETFQRSTEENVSIETFDVRFKNEMPKVGDFHIFISSGGPGDPHREGLEWEDKFAKLLDDIFEHNKVNNDKKNIYSLSVIRFSWRAFIGSLGQLTEENLILSESCRFIKQKTVKRNFY
ncbi:hypothetical protein ACFOEQ_04370 [Chryseobacterium arachidis]|uniref:hypothetical protein n=1 Tax=Chryseobacterium arachidis TaxID=1416778 RepID=UPI00362091B0